MQQSQQVGMQQSQQVGVHQGQQVGMQQSQQVVMLKLMEGNEEGLVHARSTRTSANGNICKWASSLGAFFPREIQIRRKSSLASPQGTPANCACTSSNCASIAPDLSDYVEPEPVSWAPAPGQFAFPAVTLHHLHPRPGTSVSEGRCLQPSSQPNWNLGFQSPKQLGSLIIASPHIVASDTVTGKEISATSRIATY
eukprot:gene3883-13948_t